MYQMVIPLAEFIQLPLLKFKEDKLCICVFDIPCLKKVSSGKCQSQVQNSQQSMPSSNDVSEGSRVSVSCVRAVDRPWPTPAEDVVRESQRTSDTRFNSFSEELFSRLSVVLDGSAL